MPSELIEFASAHVRSTTNSSKHKPLRLKSGRKQLSAEEFKAVKTEHSRAPQRSKAALESKRSPEQQVDTMKQAGETSPITSFLKDAGIDAETAQRYTAVFEKHDIEIDCVTPTLLAQCDVEPDHITLILSHRIACNHRRTCNFEVPCIAPASKSLIQSTTEVPPVPEAFRPVPGSPCNDKENHMTSPQHPSHESQDSSPPTSSVLSSKCPSLGPSRRERRRRRRKPNGVARDSRKATEPCGTERKDRLSSRSSLNLVPEEPTQRTDSLRTEVDQQLSEIVNSPAADQYLVNRDRFPLVQEALSALEDSLREQQNLATSNEDKYLILRQHVYLRHLKDLKSRLSRIIQIYNDQEDILSSLLDLNDRIDSIISLYLGEVAHKAEQEEHDDLQNAVVTPSLCSGLSNDAGRHSEPEGLPTCMICYSDFADTALSCEHRYCYNCLKQTVKTKVWDGEVLNIGCPDPGCDYALSESEIRHVLDEQTFEKYLQFAFLAELRTKPNARFCPNPRCCEPMMGDPNVKEMICEKCDTHFCFDCGRNWHPDVTCEQNEKLLRKEGKLQEEDRTSKWKKRHKTRPCPRCKIAIQKDKGCNHMVCSGCRYQFCWLCMQEYTDTHYYEGACSGMQFTKAGKWGNSPVAKAGRFSLTAAGIGLGGVLVLGLGIPALAVAGPVYATYELCKHQKRKRYRRKWAQRRCHTCRILVVGKQGVGKSALCSEACDVSDDNLYCTVTVEECSIPLFTSNPNETHSNDEALRHSAALADAFIICYSVVDRDSFEEAILWKEKLIAILGKEDFPVLLVANKVDLRHLNENHVTTDEGEEMAQSIGSPGLVEGNTENKAHNTAVFTSMVHQYYRKGGIDIDSINSTTATTTTTTTTANAFF